jgi:hypothetical protein
LQGACRGDEVRCLTLAVYESTKNIQDAGKGKALASKTQNVCVAVLTRILEAYDGSKMRKAATLLGDTNELLTCLDMVLDRTTTSGMVTRRDLSMRRQERARVRSLLAKQLSGSHHSTFCSIHQFCTQEAP